MCFRNGERNLCAKCLNADSQTWFFFFFPFFFSRMAGTQQGASTSLDNVTSAGKTITEYIVPAGSMFTLGAALPKYVLFEHYTSNLEKKKLARIDEDAFSFF